MGLYGVSLYGDNDNCNCAYDLRDYSLSVDSLFLDSNKCIYYKPSLHSIFTVKPFIKEHYSESYKTLSIYDTITTEMITLVNPLGSILDDITDIIGTIALIEGTFVQFIGIDEENKRFVVGMAFARHHLDSSHSSLNYKWTGGRLEPTE